MKEAYYLALLEAAYAQSQEFRLKADLSRLCYLANEIFEFTTYDDGVSAEFAFGALDVCEAISNKTTFEYIESPNKHRWYLLMCNMPFFASRLNWGTSVRGAWWFAEDGTHVIDGNFPIDGEMTYELRISEDAWDDFVRAMIRFGRK